MSKVKPKMQKSNKPTILVTNDDGINAPGIKHLWKALANVARVIVVAPEAEKSGVGLGITIHKPLHIIQNRNFDDCLAWSVNGTPADCVKLALTTLLDEPPDLVVAGINRGSNAGRNVLYSGTVGGVIEATMRGLPGIAFSCWDVDQPNYEAAEQFIPQICQHILDHSLPHGTLLNVNFPARAFSKIKGAKLTRQGRQYWIEDPQRREHPAHSLPYYWLGVKLAEFEEHEDSDIHWLNQGYVAAVPVHVSELTDNNHLQTRRQHFDQLFNQG